MSLSPCPSIMKALDKRATIEHISQWMSGYSSKAGTKGFVVGVSGGIDSALTSTLCAETGLEVLCLEMPIHQASSQVTRAYDHIDWLEKRYPNVRSVEVQLTDVFDRLVSSFPPVENEESRFMALANTRARLRMTSLYYFAAYHGYLVAGIGNKVEDFGVGFYTKYGDGGVDLSPIADLYKSEVYALAGELGVIESIMNASPTDGLWGDDRTDEDQIGASYDELEWAMEYLRLGKDKSELTGRQAQVMDIYLSFHRANRHKMVPIPVCEIPDSLRK